MKLNMKIMIKTKKNQKQNKDQLEKNYKKKFYKEKKNWYRKIVKLMKQNKKMN